MQISNSQRRALDTIKNMIEVQTNDLFAHNVMVLIHGILNIEEDEISPIKSNDELDLTLKELNEKMGGVLPVVHFPPQVWYNHKPEPIQYQTNTQEDVRYTTEVTCTGNKNCITTTYNPNDVQYTGDFRDTQTSFNDK